jgi:anaerobic magnesium-protoporphyrin IX monomethyl ester cyclase
VKILLVDPPHRIFGALRMWMPSPGLMALAAYLEAEGRECAVLDATALARPWTELASRLREGGHDIVGVTCQAATFHRDAVHAVRLVRQALPGAVIVGGGGHFTLNIDWMFEELPELDYVVLGEGEETFSQLVDWLAESGGAGRCPVPGLVWRNGGETVVNPPRPQIDDLDRLPMPAYHKMDMDNPTYFLHGMGRRAVGISTSRGCGDRCSYCSESRLWDARWRGRSGPLVVEEMEELHRRYGRSLFVFNENSFNQDRARNEAFLESLGCSGLTCDFWFQSRVKDILRDRDLLKDYRRLGLYEVMLGVESITPETLRNYTKNQNGEQVREAASLLRSHGIMVMTNVMFGDVEDTEETLREIYEVAAEIGDFLVLCITTPLPGTRYYEKALQDGRIEEHDFAKYDFMHPVMPNNAYGREEILALQKKYLKKYYTRPGVLLKMAASPNPFIRMAYRLIMRYAWYEARHREWVQPNWEDVPEALLRPAG